MEINYDDPIQRRLLELLEFYTLPGEAEQAFVGWWDELNKILKEK